MSPPTHPSYVDARTGALRVYACAHTWMATHVHTQTEMHIHCRLAPTETDVDTRTYDFKDVTGG